MIRTVFQRGFDSSCLLRSSKVRFSQSSCLSAASDIGIQLRFSSSESSGDVNHEDEAKKDAGGSKSAESTKKLPTFPWRSSKEPLDRLIEGDDLSGLPPRSRTRYFRPLLVASELQIPFFEAIFSSGWKNELAQDFSYAFQKGIAGLLSWKYEVPIEIIDLDENGVVFDSKIKDDIGAASAGKDFVDTYDAKKASIYVRSMLESKLIDMYKNVPEHLRLEMKPIGEPKIESTYVVPALTRSVVDQNPSLKGLYSRLEREINDQSMNMSQMQEQAAKLVEKSGNTGTIRTIFADVSINCMELFGTDAEEPSEVTHLVRFEMETRRGDLGERVPTKWRIVDWDNLLDGNAWA